MSMPNQDPVMMSHMTLRKLLGFLGFLLPVILIAGMVFKNEAPIIQPSISDYYHTGMRDVFVIVVASFGLFLFTYKGYKAKSFWTNDSLFTNAAGVFAILVALCPTNATPTCEVYTCYVHFTAATLFFTILAYISYFIFTLSNKPPAERTPQKRIRNRVFRICGITMALCIVALILYFAFFKQVWPGVTVFIFETVALWAFGFSWLTKGEAIWADS